MKHKHKISEHQRQNKDPMRIMTEKNQNETSHVQRTWNQNGFRLQLSSRDLESKPSKF